MNLHPLPRSNPVLTNKNSGSVNFRYCRFQSHDCRHARPGIPFIKPGPDARLVESPSNATHGLGILAVVTDKYVVASTLWYEGWRTPRVILGCSTQPCLDISASHQMGCGISVQVPKLSLENIDHVFA